MGVVGTKKVVFALSLASAVALGIGLLVTTEVRAGALDSADQSVDFDETIESEEAEESLPSGLSQADRVVEATKAVDASVLEQARAFEGQWTFVGGQKQRDGVEDAIQASADALGRLIRGIGAKRLRESNPIPNRITIKLQGESIEIAYDGNSNKAKLDGTTIKSVSPQGDKSKISHTIRGAKLVQFIDGEGGDKTNKFKLSEDGSKLYLDVKITSSRLPVPCAYRLTFKRKG